MIWTGRILSGLAVAFLLFDAVMKFFMDKLPPEALEAGAALGNMGEVWGSPASAIPGESYDGRELSRLVVPERACPHAILVNQRGLRFVNEGATYNELGKK